MENTDWIPCKEKMPEKFEAVLVTLKNKQIFTARYMSHKFMKITLDMDLSKDLMGIICLNITIFNRI